MNNLQNILQTRCTFYAFLARIFRTEADQQLLEALNGISFPEKSGDPVLDAGYAALTRWKTAPGSDLLTELAVDYARVFLGAGVAGKDAAYPYESVYTSPQGLVMQQAWEDVCRIYHAHGLKKPDHCDVHEDHVALELDFMAKLSSDALNAAEREDDTALLKTLAESLSFARGHLLNWLPGFSTDVAKYAETPFYAAAAQIALAFTQLDASMVEELLKELHGTAGEISA